MTDPTVETVADLDAAREDWTRLAAAAGNPFSTWEWASAWWRHFGGDRELLLRRCRTADGRVAAILPLYLAAERPLRVLRFLGHGRARGSGLAGAARRSGAGPQAESDPRD